MALKGRKPAIAICGMVARYQGRGGISRGYLVVRHGAWNSTLLFLPATPPRTSKGKVTSIQMRRITKIVPNGSAAVALYIMATVLRKQNVRNRGPQNRNPVISKFLTCKQKCEYSGHGYLHLYHTYFWICCKCLKAIKC